MRKRSKKITCEAAAPCDQRCFWLSAAPCASWPGPKDVSSGAQAAEPAPVPRNKAWDTAAVVYSCWQAVVSMKRVSDTHDYAVYIAMQLFILSYLSCLLGPRKDTGRREAVAPLLLALTGLSGGPPCISTIILESQGRLPMPKLPR